MQHVLDRLRGRVRHVPERVPLRAADGRARSAPSTTSAALTQDDLLDFLPQMVRLQDEPIADPVCVPVYYVSKLARDNGVIVCQVGEGADELFWGYPSWKTLLAPAALRTTLPVPRVAEARRRRRSRRAPARARGARSSSCAAARAGQPVFWGGAEAFTRGAEAAAALAAAARAARRADVVGGDRSRSASASSARRWEPSHLHWMSTSTSTCACPSCC